MKKTEKSVKFCFRCGKFISKDELFIIGNEYICQSCLDIIEVNGW